MHSKVYWLHQTSNQARIGIMARPRGEEWLQGEIAILAKQGIGVMVSLLESHEIRELGLSRQPDLCAQYDIQFINYPIPDRNIPAHSGKVRDLVTSLQQSLSNGKTIVIHCRMGIGRSSIIAGCLLLHLGLPFNNLIEHVSKARRLKVPDTEEQVNWLKKWNP